MGKWAWMLVAAVAWGQEPVGPRRGDEVGGYNITNSVEAGYRFTTAGGAVERYRSDVNFGNGARVLSSQLAAYAREGKGWLFDSLTFATLGLGNDPYEMATARVEKNRLYRYDLLWRQTDYFNPAAMVAGGLHRLDTTRTVQDHDLTLLPGRKYGVMVGYSRNRQSGAGLSTMTAFDSRGDAIPLFSDVRREENEYRLGGEAEVWGAKLQVVRGWDFYKDDTAQAGTGFHRAEPYHGASPYWRVHVMREGGKWMGVNGRFAYSAGRRNFVLDENTVGAVRVGVSQNRQVWVTGDARRPMANGDLTVTLVPGARWTIVNQTSFHSLRMEGDAAYRELNNATLTGNVVYFQSLGIRTVVNTTDALYRASRWLSVHGGYQFSDRRVRSVESSEFFGDRETVPGLQENRIHAGVAGVRLEPWKPLVVVVDGEIDRADRPFYPVSDKNYHALSARVRYKVKTLSVAARASSAYNNNWVAFSAASSRTRNYTADVAWTPRSWWAVDAGYAKLHLDTLGGMAYFASGSGVGGVVSAYGSNVHSVNAGVRMALRGRADVSLGYQRVEDRGDGRAGVQTFPVAYQSPVGRLSVRLHERLRWNFGYQYYGYRERFFGNSNYRAHTGYSSLLWSF